MNLKKEKFCEEKGIFQSVSLPPPPSAPHAFRRTHNVYYISQQKMSILIISGRNWICRRGKRKMGGRILVITKQNVAPIGRVEDHPVTDGNEIRTGKLNYN